MKDDIKKFTAKDARALVDGEDSPSEELESLLRLIKTAAENREDSMPVYRPLTRFTTMELGALGFDVYYHSAIEIQKDNLWYTIKW